jgi:uncharacterized protein YaaN involved in tellurite resistance
LAAASARRSETLTEHITQNLKIMKTETNENKASSTAKEPGFFTRILNKVDQSMKAKAEQAAKSSCCSGDKNGKGGKCC